MIQTLQQNTVNALSYVVDTFEKYDESVKERQRVFGTDSKAIQDKEQKAAPGPV